MSTEKAWRAAAQLFEERGSLTLYDRRNLVITLRTANLTAMHLVTTQLFPKGRVHTAGLDSDERTLRLSREADVQKFFEGTLPYFGDEARAIAETSLEYLRLCGTDDATVMKGVALLMEVGSLLEVLREAIPRRVKRWVR